MLSYRLLNWITIQFFVHYFVQDSAIYLRWTKICATLKKKGGRQTVLREKHRMDTEELRHFTFSKKFARSLKPKFVYSGVLKKQPGWEAAEHRHGACEILYIRSGSGRVRAAGTEFAVRSGDLVVYDPGSSTANTPRPTTPSKPCSLPPRAFGCTDSNPGDCSHRARPP